MPYITATCHTADCGNAGYPINLEYTDEFGPPGSVTCGPCGQPITDVVDHPDDPLPA